MCCAYPTCRCKSDCHQIFQPCVPVTCLCESRTCREPCSPASLSKNVYKAFRNWRDLPVGGTCDLNQYAAQNLPRTPPLTERTIAEFHCLPLMPCHQPLRNLQCGSWSLKPKVADALRPACYPIPGPAPGTGCRTTSYPVEFRRTECCLDDMPVPRNDNLHKSSNAQCDTTFTPLPPYTPQIGCWDYRDNSNNCNNNTNNNCNCNSCNCCLSVTCPIESSVCQPAICRPGCTGHCCRNACLKPCPTIELREPCCYSSAPQWHCHSDYPTALCSVTTFVPTCPPADVSDKVKVTEITVDQEKPQVTDSAQTSLTPRNVSEYMARYIKPRPFSTMFTRHTINPPNGIHGFRPIGGTSRMVDNTHYEDHYQWPSGTREPPYYLTTYKL